MKDWLGYGDGPHFTELSGPIYQPYIPLHITDTIMHVKPLSFRDKLLLIIGGKLLVNATYSIDKPDEKTYELFVSNPIKNLWWKLQKRSRN